jgi:hypothetical protein
VANYTVKPHAVTGARITRTEPIYDQGAMVAPDRGLMLVMDDGSSEKWVADRFGVVPQIGDFLVCDPELHCTVVVPAARFSELFAEAALGKE